MKVDTVKINTPQTFNGLHVSPKVLKELGCSKDTFLRNPAIKKCAQNYEVLIKRGNVISNGESDFMTTAIKGILASAFGLSAGSLASIISAIHGTLTPASGAVLTAGGMLGGLGVYALYNLFKPKDAEYEYIIQGGKGISKDGLNKNKLTGILSEEHRIKDSSEIKNIKGLTEEILRNDAQNFSEIINAKYRDYDFGNTGNILAFLQDGRIKKDFYNGDCFNHKINTNGDTLLTKFFDITPDEKNRNEYNQIIEIMKNMKAIDYNQQDSYGISVLEKILNSENLTGLSLVKNYHFPYSKELDYAYENIRNSAVKRRAKMLNIEFTIPFEALKMQSKEALDKAMEEFDSPFCNKTKLAGDMVNFAKRNCNNSFVRNVLFRKLNEKNLLSGDMLSDVINTHQNRWNRLQEFER